MVRGPVPTSFPGPFRVSTKPEKALGTRLGPVRGRVPFANPYNSPKTLVHLYSSLKSGITLLSVSPAKLTALVTNEASRGTVACAAASLVQWCALTAV